MGFFVLLLSRLAEVSVPACDNFTGSAEGCVNIPKVSANSGQVTQILQIAFGIIGVLAVVIIIFAGFQLMTSLGGNPDAAKKARNTIIYAVLGLILAISAEFLVTFVLDKI